MLTTAGSTRFTIPENELEDGTGSGTVSGVALVPEKFSAFMAETRPETTVPIMMPAASVSDKKTAARILRLRAQPTKSFTCSPIVRLLFLLGPQTRFPKYNTAICTRLRDKCSAAGGLLYALSAVNCPLGLVYASCASVCSATLCFPTLHTFDAPNQNCVVRFLY